MRTTNTLKIIYGLIGLVTIAAVGLLVLVSSTHTEVVPPQPTDQVAAGATPKVVPTSVSSFTATVPALSTAPSITEVAVGQAYVRPYTQASTLLDLEVVRVADAPLISQDTAITALYNRLGKADWLLGKGGLFQGHPVTLASATYGAVTQGERSPDGLWIGILNIHEENCPLDGSKCKPTGVVLDHLENRVMWVFDYAGVNQDTGGNVNGPGCTPTATESCKPPSHIVYGVDAKTLQFFHLGAY